MRDKIKRTGKGLGSVMSVDALKPVALAVLGQLEYYPHFFKLSDGTRSIESLAIKFPETDWVAQGLVEALETLGFEKGKDIQLVHPGTGYGGKGVNSESPEDFDRDLHARKGSRSPVGAEIYFNFSGLEKLISIGVRHPVLDAMAKAHGIERSSHTASVRK